MKFFRILLLGLFFVVAGAFVGARRVEAQCCAYVTHSVCVNIYDEYGEETGDLDCSGSYSTCEPSTCPDPDDIVVDNSYTCTTGCPYGYVCAAIGPGYSCYQTVGSSPPPPPPPAAGYCGDGICTGGCGVCVADCGVCPSGGGIGGSGSAPPPPPPPPQDDGGGGISVPPPPPPPAPSNPPGNAAPGVTIISPPHGANYVPGTLVAIYALAVDPDGSVVSVSFYENGVFIGSDTTPTYSAGRTLGAPGVYCYTAAALDNGGAYGYSTGVCVTVTPPSSCVIDAPASLEVPYTLTEAMNVSVTNQTGGVVNRMNFTPANSSIISATSPDTSSPFSSVVTGVNPGTTNLVAQGVMSTGAVCSDVTSVETVLFECDAPVVLAPSEPTTCAPTETTPGSAVWQWQTVDFADEYEVDVLNANNGSVAINNSWQSEGTFSCGGGTCTYTSPLVDNDYYIRVRAQGICTPSVFSTSEEQTVDRCTYEIGGAGVFDDPDGLASINPATGRCELPGASSVLPGIGSLISNSQGTTTVNPDGTFSPIIALGSNNPYLTTLSIGDPSEWISTCPRSGTYSVTVPNPLSGSGDVTDMNYYVTDSLAAWYQVIGGSVHANSTPGSGLSVRIPVPFTCAYVPYCQPYAILQDDAGTADSSGLITHDSGEVDVTGRSIVERSPVDEEGHDRIAISQLSPYKENYAFIYRLFEFPLSPQNDLVSNPGKPGGGGANGNGAYYRDGDMSIDSQWNVGGGESVVVFVNGDLNVNAETHVAEGGFLGFVVAGDINFSSSLGSGDPASEEAVVEGVYIADGSININSNGGVDLKFVGEGNFVGWSGVGLGRDFDGQNNNWYPTEVFRFRPDLVVNAPDGFKRSYYIWQEIAP